MKPIKLFNTTHENVHLENGCTQKMRFSSLYKNTCAGGGGGGGGVTHG